LNKSYSFSRNSGDCSFDWGNFVIPLLPEKCRKITFRFGWVGKRQNFTRHGQVILTGAWSSFFGKMLQNSGVGDLVLPSTMSDAKLGKFPLPFLIAFGLKTAQGSTTVAMITTASIIAPILDHWVWIARR